MRDPAGGLEAPSSPPAPFLQFPIGSAAREVMKRMAEAPAHEQASAIRDGRVRKHHVWSLLTVWSVTHSRTGNAGVQSRPHLV